MNWLIFQIVLLICQVAFFFWSQHQGKMLARSIELQIELMRAMNDEVLKIIESEQN
jgi:hypothetical protein